MIMNYMPEVRDRILSRLAEQKPDYVQTVEGRNALVQLLTKDLEAPYLPQPRGPLIRSEEHTSELQSLMRISYAVFCLKKKNKNTRNKHRIKSTTTNRHN